MTLVSWSPFREFDDLFNQYSRLVGRGRSAGNEASDVAQAAAAFRPVANISESADEYRIRAELPEVDKKDIDVSVHEGVLTIRGERKLTASDEKHHRIESFYGQFARSFALPADVDDTKISAESRDGVLTVRLPKSVVAKPKAIEVQVR